MSFNDCATAEKVRFPEGFSMRAEVQRCLLALRAARVDKPRKEEAAGIPGTGYGERAQTDEADVATGARLTVLDALAAVISRQLGRKHFAD